MLKKKTKILFLLTVAIILFCNVCFATEEVEPISEIQPRTETEAVEPVVTSEDETTSEVEEVIDESTLYDESSDWVNNDLYLSGDSVVIDKIVDGNVFVVANEVVVTGEIGGDLFVCASKLTIDGGYVYSNLFALANEMVVDGVIYDVYAIANHFTLSENGFIYRDLKVSANVLNISGMIKRDAYVIANTYNFNTENGKLIGGNLNYSAASEIDIPEDLVTGNINFDQKVVKEETLSSRILSYVLDIVNNLVFVFIVVLLCLWLAPKFTDRVTTMSTKKAFASFGIGIVAPIIAFLVILLFILSSVFVNVAFASLLILIAICMSGTAFASIYFGSKLAKLIKFEGKLKLVISSLVVALLIWVIGKIPQVGGFIAFLIALFGIGTLLVNVVYRKDVKKDEPVVTE